MSDLYFFFAESFLTHILISGHKTEHSFTFFSLLFFSPITLSPITVYCMSSQKWSDLV